MEPLVDVAVITDPAVAEASLGSLRGALLAELATAPGSATTLAATLGISRQTANYHLRILETHGLVELVEERVRGSKAERILRATASSFVISPSALASVAPDPARAPDQRSLRWLLALASRLVQDVGELIIGSQAAGQPVATLGMESTIRFASAADRAAFAAEYATAVNDLVAKYHHAGATQGRDHRLVAALHPAITRPISKEHHP